MSTHIDLWDTETGNLINSWRSLATALVALKAAVRDGSDAWLGYAVLVVVSDDDTPILLAEGDDLRALVIPESMRTVAAAN